MKDAPRFGVDSGENGIRFIDEIVTSSKGVDDSSLADLVVRQLHSHSQTCEKKGQVRFNFPQPPMRNTVILYPLDDEMSSDERAKQTKQFKTVSEKTNNMRNGEDISFDELLGKLSVSEEDYLLAIRSSLVAPRVFLKRQPDELRVNKYNQACLLAWRANMDIQFVLDVHACAMYIVSYISKGQR